MTLFKTCSVLLLLVATCNGARRLSQDPNVKDLKAAVDVADAAVADATAAVADAKGILVEVLVLAAAAHDALAAATAEPTIDLGTAIDYAILAAAGISTVPNSVITGNIGVSPIAATAMTGFSLVLHSSGKYSTSTQVTGKCFGASYAVPTPAKLTTAVADMLTAYTDAASRPHTQLNFEGGLLGGKTLYPGVYSFKTGILVTSDMTIEGTDTDIFIIQTTGIVTLATGVQVILKAKKDGGTVPQPKNIIWQVAGQVIMEVGSHMEGTLLVKTAAVFKTNASLNGRVLAQTAVTLDQVTITEKL